MIESINEWIKSLEEAIEDLESDSFSHSQVERNKRLSEILMFLKLMEENIRYDTNRNKQD
ncbi:MAG: hypothetical protein JXR50_06325 [Prolixibacteraceae bacterium]|nr:hypothetical protein [Prolixibacteraceae bacterium]